MAGKKGKQAVICLSSSSESGEESEEEEVEEEDDDDNDVEDEEETSSQSCSDEGSDWSGEGSDWSDEEEAGSESLEDGDDDEDGSESTKPVDIEASCNRVINLLKADQIFEIPHDSPNAYVGGADLQELKLEECKAYLRKHGLRLTGNKAVCVQRIQEHWRIKDGNGEKLYPRSSFVINCTGDVCKGDVVLFTQKVYERYDKVTRNGNLLGNRTIAGRVVKESYGAAKQQHTFTVEILWSKGFKRLPPLFPLLVKGRNLYRLKTFRQRWDDEKERARVLAEKHRRGTAARRLRAMKIAQSANRGSKRRRQSYRAGSPKRRRSQEFVPSTETKRRKCIDSRGKAPLHKQEKTERVHKAKLHTQAKTKTVPKAMIPKLSLRNLQDKVPMFHAYTQNGDPQTQLWSQMQYRPRNSQFMGHESGGPCHVSNYKAGLAPDALRLAPFRPYTNPMVAPALRHQEYNQRTNGFPTYADSVYQLDARNVNHFVDQGSTYIQNIMGAEIYRGQRSCFLHCSMPGCGDLGANGCVVSSCWKCCRRTGRKCLRHQ